MTRKDCDGTTATALTHIRTCCANSCFKVSKDDLLLPTPHRLSSPAWDVLTLFACHKKDPGPTVAKLVHDHTGSHSLTQSQIVVVERFASHFISLCDFGLKHGHLDFGVLHWALPPPPGASHWPPGDWQDSCHWCSAGPCPHAGSWDSHQCLLQWHCSCKHRWKHHLQPLHDSPLRCFFQALFVSRRFRGSQGQI